MEQNRFRCHASVIIENLGGAFWFIVLMLFSSLEDSAELFALLLKGEVTLFQALAGVGVVLIFIIIIVVYNWVVWSKTWISIDNEAIVIERNMLNRKVNTIGMKNISNINTEQNIFERIVGTYKIKLDTNSATTANETDVKIILSKDKAEWFKQQVMLCMNSECNEIIQEVEVYDVEYKAKDIIMHCIYTASPIAVLFCVAFIVGCAVLLQFVDTGAVLVDGLINVLGSVFAILVIVGSAFQSLIRDFFVYYGFKARRQENKIYLSHGFFKKRQYTIAVDKINAVEIESPVVSRILGRQFVKVICVGVGDEENENSMILLSEKTEVMREKLSVLLPEFVIKQPEIIPRDKNSVWGEVIGFLINVLLWGAVAIVFGVIDLLEIETIWIRTTIVAVCVLILCLVLFGIYLSFKTCGIGMAEDNLLIVMGVYRKTATWIPYAKIQELEYSQGPIDRHFGIANGIIYILAATLNSIHAVSYFKIEVFDEIHKRMLQRKGNRD